MTAKLFEHLVDYLTRSFYCQQANNLDVKRFPNKVRTTNKGLKKRIIALIKRPSLRYGLLWIGPGNLRQYLVAFGQISGKLEALEVTYEILGDSHSKRRMVEILAFRVLGRQHVKLSFNTSDYWRAVEDVQSYVVSEESSYPETFLGRLNKYDLRRLSYPVVLWSQDVTILGTYAFEQYRYVGTEHNIQVRAGDIVIDGGACWGDTALYFASLVGASGVVYSFEFSPANLAILRDNLQSNPILKDRVRIEAHPLWHTSNKEIHFSEHGPGTRIDTVNQPDSQVKVTTVSIDDFVQNNGLDRVDFIKLDIEGAELAALQGAERVLRSFRPTLAIAIYHNLDDLVSIPQFLSSLELGYNFYLGHFSIHLEETILFASPSSR